MTRTIKNSVFVAWRYLRFHTARSLIIIFSLSIVIFVPIFIEIMIASTQDKLLERGNATPLLLGSNGSAIDLTINSLHFSGNKTNDFPISHALDIDKTELAYSIPLYTRFKASQHNVVGTTIDYFNFRGLKINKGRNIALLGDAVIGAKAASELGYHINDTIISSSENLFDLAGVYPLQLKIVGILGANGTDDDDAIFTDIKTTWIMAGIGHGHQDLNKSNDQSVILEKNDDEIIANSKLRTHNVITASNLDNFHFHGDMKSFPISAAIVVPNDHKALSLLLGRYQNNKHNLQLIQPKHSIQVVLDSIFRVKKLFYTIVITISISTLLTIFLAFMLSIRLRAKELNTIFRMGCSKGAIRGFIVAEVGIITLSSLLISAVFIVATHFLTNNLFHFMTG